MLGIAIDIDKEMGGRRRRKTYCFFVQADVHIQQIDEGVECLFLAFILDGRLSRVEVVNKLLNGTGANTGTGKDHGRSRLRENKTKQKT